MQTDGRGLARNGVVGSDYFVREGLAVKFIIGIGRSGERFGGQQSYAPCEFSGEVIVVVFDKTLDVVNIFIIGVEQILLIVNLGVETPNFVVLNAGCLDEVGYRVHVMIHQRIQTIGTQLVEVTAYGSLKPRVIPKARIPSFDGHAAAITKVDGELVGDVTLTGTVVITNVEIPQRTEKDVIVVAFLIYKGAPKSVRIGAYFIGQIPRDERSGVNILLITKIFIGERSSVKNSVESVDKVLDVTDLSGVYHVGIRTVNANVAAVVGVEVETVACCKSFRFQKIST